MNNEALELIRKIETDVHAMMSFFQQKVEVMSENDRAAFNSELYEFVCWADIIHITHQDAGVLLHGLTWDQKMDMPCSVEISYETLANKKLWEQEFLRWVSYRKEEAA